MKTTKGQEYRYKKLHDEVKQIQIKHPDRVPILVSLHEDCKISLLKSKYLVPKDLTYGQFLFVIRNKLNLQSSKAIFIFFGENLPHQTMKIIDIYNDHKSDDGFLRATLSEENTFG
jgi:GABA(A) receptor-associated protein